MDKYFTKLPVIEYNGKFIKDISRSVRLDEESRARSALFYPLQIQAGFRGDNLAEAYYEDAEMDWLIWLTNDIVDPYYNWYLSEREFENFIVKKYGDYDSAKRKVAYYQTNWASLEETITATAYDNTIIPVLKKYYTPVFGLNNKIMHYKRLDDDWTVNTNRLFSATVEWENANTFSEGDVLSFYNFDDTDVQVGTAEVDVVNGNTVIYKHLSGNTSPTDGIIRNDANYEATFVSGTLLSENITSEENIYWESVSIFDLEFKKNEARKNLYVINAEYAMEISERIRLSLKD